MRFASVVIVSCLCLPDRSLIIEQLHSFARSINQPINRTVLQTKHHLLLKLSLPNIISLSIAIPCIVVFMYKVRKHESLETPKAMSRRVVTLSLVTADFKIHCSLYCNYIYVGSSAAARSYTIQRGLLRI
jgi:hypothetical protein